MTHDNNHANSGAKRRLATVRGVSRMPGYEPFTPSVLRHLIFAAEDRTGSAGTVIRGNGLGTAIIRIGRKILIDLDRFDAWIESHRDGG